MGLGPGLVALKHERLAFAGDGVADAPSTPARPAILYSHNKMWSVGDTFVQRILSPQCDVACQPRLRQGVAKLSA